ncbi:MAG: ABC transporter ATP-binding protein [Alphaproteobacteria bacterium]
MSTLALAGIVRRFGRGAHVARALDGVDLALCAGEIVGLVGESGCGKSTLARIAVGLDRPDAGTVLCDGRPLFGDRGRVARPMRQRIQLVFQEPLASFNPRRTVGGSIAMPLRALRMADGDTGAAVAALLEQVGLDPGLARRRPHALSGGQLQRAAIARALAPRPDFLVCDEPVASLDVSVRAQVLNLLLDQWRERGVGILFISHDLGVVRRIADRVAVMYLGRVVEIGAGETVWAAPAHPYTRALAAAVPAGRADRAGPGLRLGGEPPRPYAVPAGCRFHPRCPLAVDRCRREDPALRPLASGRMAACHLAG